MSLSPFQPLLRPASAHPALWQAQGMPAAFAFILDHFWHHRVVGWVGYPEESLLALEGVWEMLGEVTTPEGLVDWTARMRLLLWDSIDRWSEQVETDQSVEDLAIRHMSRARARFLLGEALFDWVAEDDWQDYLRLLDLHGVTYTDLDKLYARRFRERLASQPVHPEPEGGYSLRQIRRLANHLAERFGFRSLATAGGMPLSDVWSALREAEVGLGAMAQELAWPDQEIGGHRLGLAFELAKDYQGTDNTHHTQSGHYDPDLSLVHMGRNGGWGSFAHEWAHAIDEAVGLGWSPKAMGVMRFASVRAANPQAILRGAQAELDAFRTYEVPVLTQGQSVLALRQALLQFPEQLQAFHAHLPHPGWDERLTQRIQAMLPWREEVLHGHGTPRQWLEQWERWKQDNEEAFAHPDTPATRIWRGHWNRSIAAAELLFFGPAPGRPLWRAQSALRDAVEGKAYWDTPHEAFARMIHMIVRQGIDADTWVASETPLQMDVFPRGADLAAGQAWWHAQSALLRRHWAKPPHLLQLAWAGQQVILTK